MYKNDHFFFDAEREAWVVTGLNQAKQILQNNKFRKPKQNEANDLMSPSFFLALEIADEKEHPRLRKEFTKSFSMERVKHIESEVLAGIAKSLIQKFNLKQEVDIIKEYIDPYCKAAIYQIIGIEYNLGEEITASFIVCNRFFQNEGNQSLSGKAAFKILYDKIYNLYNENYNNNTDNLGSIQYTFNTDSLTTEEKVAFILPFFEMLSLNTHHELPTELITRVACNEEVQNRLRECYHHIYDAAEEAARLLNPKRDIGPYLTRIAQDDILIDDELIKRDERVILKIVDTGIDETVFNNATEFNPYRKELEQHLGFGHGLHRCLGKHLAKSLSVVALRVLLESTRRILATDDSNILKICY